MQLLREDQENLLKVHYARGHDQYRDVLRGLSSFLGAKVSPESLALERGQRPLAAVRSELFAQGVCGIPFAEEFGGAGLPFGVYVLAMELVGAADASTAMSIGIHNTVAEAIAQFGSPEQKRSLLPALLSGKKLAAFALTEPSSGSDAKAMRTKIVRRGSSFVVNGSKMFITNAGEADVYLVFGASEKAGHSAVLVDGANPGLMVGKGMQKLGMRASRTAELTFADCQVAEGSLLGAEGEAFEYAKALLNPSRVVMGMICVGIAETAYRKALTYASQRRLFGKTLSEFQLTKEKLSEMRTGINAARLACMYAARLREAGIAFASEAAQAKLIATETAAATCDGVIQIFGGYGYVDDDVHRHWRDARLLTIGEGASEVLRMLIASMELERAS